MGMNLILFDDEKRSSFLPLAHTRPVCDLLTGMSTNRLRWESRLGATSSTLTEDYLQQLFPLHIDKDNLLINGRLYPSEDHAEEVRRLKLGEKLLSADTVLAARMSGEELEEMLKPSKFERTKLVHLADIQANSSNFKAALLNEVWDLFLLCGDFMKWDLEHGDMDGMKRKGGEGNTLIGNDIHIHSEASVRASVLNSEAGPIVIESGAEVMEGCLIRGPFYLGRNSTLKMGARIYGPTSIGEHCKVGGEINNSVINSYSNKAHDGFLGNSVLGQWCNLGADSNNSNLKNDYSIVKLWNYEASSFVKSGLQFLGLVMGDHSKCGINTMFNTGTVAGVFCNIYGSGFQPNFIPSFSWGKPSAFQTYDLGKAMQVAAKVMQRRDVKLSREEEAVLKHVFELETQLREKFNKVP